METYEIIFSIAGIVLTIIFGIIGLFVVNKQKSKTQKQCVKDDSIGIQAGGDVKINNGR